MEFSAEIIVAIGAAAALAALAFRQMSTTVIKLNDELQELLRERREGEAERQTLQQRVAELESRLSAMVTQLDGQSQEIDLLRRKLQDCSELVEAARTQAKAQVG